MSRIFQLPRQVPVVSGAVSPGAKAHFYLTGTTTNTNTYTDAALTTPSSNPVVADAAGVFATIYLDPDIVYKLTLNDSTDSLIYTEDPIQDSLTAANIGKIIYPITTEETNGSVTPTNYQYEPGDIRRYGSTGDGAADDGSAFLDAVNQQQQGGVNVKLGRDETYLLTTWTVKTTTAALRIDGNGATVKGGASTDLFIVEHDVEVYNTKFDTHRIVFWRTDTTSITIDHIHIDGCEFDTCQDGMLISCLYNSAIISNNYFHDITTKCITLGSNTRATYQDGQRGVTITGNSATNIVNAGAGNVAFCLLYGTNAVVSGNSVYNVSASTGECWGIYTKTLNASITGNVIEKMTAGTATDVHCINIKGVDRADATTNPQGFSHVVSGNVLNGVNEEGDGIDCHPPDVSINGNYIADFDVGIFVGSSGNADNVSVVGNTIWSTTGAGSSNGISVIGNRIAINSNVIEGPDRGIVFRGATTTYSGMTICNNIISNCTTYGIYDNGSAVWEDQLISGNVFRNCPTTGILIGVSGSWSDVTITDNTFTDITTNPTLPIKFNAANVSKWTIDGNKFDSVQTTNASETPVIQLGVLLDEEAVAIEFTAVGKKSDTTDRGVHKVAGLFYRDGAGAAQHGSDTAVYSIASTSTWTGQGFALSSNSVQCTVTGVAATTIDWDVMITAKSV